MITCLPYCSPRRIAHISAAVNGLTEPRKTRRGVYCIEVKPDRLSRLDAVQRQVKEMS